MNSLNIQTREKRGLANVLGTVVKFITGNLDNNDAEYYDQAIKDLKDSNNKASINYAHLIKYFNDTSSKINNNFAGVSIAINDVRRQIATRTKEDFIRNHILNLENFNSKLQTVIDIINVAKINVLHSSLISPKELIEEMKTMQLENHKFPFELLTDHSYLIETLATVKAYQRRSKFIFIIGIPLVDNNEYQYYELYPLPSLINHKYVEIVPQTRFIAANDDNYLLINEPCQFLFHNLYLCRNKLNHHDKNNCELNIVIHGNLSLCKFNEIIVDSIKILEHPDITFIIAKDNIEIKETCSKFTRTLRIQGTYEILTNNSCKYTINNTIIQNYFKIKNDLQFFIPQLGITNITINKDPTLMLQNITNYVQDRLPIVENNVFSVNVTFYVIGTILLILCVVWYINYKWKNRSIFNIQENVTSSEGRVMHQDLQPPY